MAARTYWRVKPIAGLTAALEAARAPADIAQHSLFDAHLAQAHWHLAMASSIAAASAHPPTPLPPADLLLAPREILAGRISETWRESAAAERRYRAIRKVTRNIDRTRRDAGGLTLGPSTVEFTYPASVTVPPIGGVS